MDTRIDHSMFESLYECAGCNVVSLCEQPGPYSSVQIAMWRVCMLSVVCRLLCWPTQRAPLAWMLGRKQEWGRSPLWFPSRHPRNLCPNTANKIRLFVKQLKISTFPVKAFWPSFVHHSCRSIRSRRLHRSDDRRSAD